jgi:branched-subunit amino acid transport protein
VTEIVGTIAAVALASAALKATGPVLVGGGELPSWARTVIALLAPALLAALVVSGAFSEDGRLDPFDPRVAGVATTAVALALRAPMLVAIALASAVTAGLRALG